jgi:hypothetical protein
MGYPEMKPPEEGSEISGSHSGDYQYYCILARIQPDISCGLLGEPAVTICCYSEFRGGKFLRIDGNILADYTESLPTGL